MCEGDRGQCARGDHIRRNSLIPIQGLQPQRHCCAVMRSSGWQHCAGSRSERASFAWRFCFALLVCIILLIASSTLLLLGICSAFFIMNAGRNCFLTRSFPRLFVCFEKILFNFGFFFQCAVYVCSFLLCTHAEILDIYFMGVMETGVERNGIKENRQISSYSTNKRRRSEGNPFDSSTALPSSYFPPSC